MDEISGEHVAENISLGPRCESVRFAMLVLNLNSFAESADSEVGSDDAKKSHAALIILFIDHYNELYT